jgi:hypothetical protein
VGEGLEQVVSNEHRCTGIEVNGLFPQGSRDALDCEDAFESEDEDVPAVESKEVEGRKDGRVVEASEDGGLSGEGVTRDLIGGSTAKGTEPSELRGSFAHSKEFARQAPGPERFECSVAGHPVDGV